jgi:hypothetical protein
VESVYVHMKLWTTMYILISIFFYTLRLENRESCDDFSPTFIDTYSLPTIAPVIPPDNTHIKAIINTPFL